MGGGAMLPLMIVLFGDLTSAFVSNDALGEDEQAEICAMAPQCCPNGE